MNIYIPDSWLREYLKTKAKPEKIAEVLSLTSASVEKIEKKGKDDVYYLEITTNRVDMMSVLGVAREAKAALPEFEIKAELKKEKENADLKIFNKVDYLKVEIKKKSLCPRFAAVLIEIEKMGKGLRLIKERLEKVGVRSLNPIVDVTNYLMFAIGQPMHVFDYEKIGKGKMVVRESKKGEEIVTLDGAKRKLFKGAIVIEDGKGKLIDLCGIMGARNSRVDEKTKKILLFVQNYDPVRIRRTMQALNLRTEAGTRFEKGIDSEMVLDGLKKGVNLYKKVCKVKKVHKGLDIYKNRLEKKSLELDTEKVRKVMGVAIKKEKITAILKRLEFKVKGKNEKLLVTPPSFRREDILIEEDLIEEVARIYGYHNLPIKIPQTDFLLDKGWERGAVEKEVKLLLTGLGFTETYTYSMISKELIIKSGGEIKNYLKISNPLTKDRVFMRQSIIPSLLLVFIKNRDYFEKINLFELSRVYLKRKNNLPDEPRRLSGLSNKMDFFEIKGIIEVLFDKLGVDNVDYRYLKEESKIWDEYQTGEIVKEKEVLGRVGVIKKDLVLSMEGKGKVVGFELDFEKVVKNRCLKKTYKPVAKYPPVIQDLTVITEDALIGDLIEAIYSASKLIDKVELIDQYKKSNTFRIYFLDREKNLTDTKASKIREKVVKLLEKKFSARIKKV